MELISTATVGAGGASSITFSSIPGTYTDLVLCVSSRNTSSGNDWLTTQVNSVSSGYTWRILAGDGSSASSYNSSSFAMPAGFVSGLVFGTNATASTFANSQIVIPNYLSTATKTFSSDSVMENNASNPANQSLSVGSSGVTSAITSVTILLYNGANFAQYSTASLYGILKGSGGATVS